MKFTLRRHKKEAPEEAPKKVPKEIPLPKPKPPTNNGFSKLAARLPSLGANTHYVLLIGDEGAILLYTKGNTVVSRQFVADASASNLDELRDTIAQDRKAPITMLIDSVDQSFVQQTLPPVSSLSVQKLIKRRLERDFRPADIKGAIVLGRAKEGRKDWNFLMVSVEKSPQLVLWLDFVMTFENRFRGIVLLSVEAGIFVKQLERALGISPKTGTGAEWKILVSHNKVGGFRQIILRHGRMIFTRLALPVGEPTPPVIAGNIEQEMMSTIEYLKRFGFNAKSGLDVYIIASEEVSALVESRRFEAQSFHAFSPHTVAGYLGIKGATQPTDQFGDVVMAAAIGGIKKNILKLTTLESRLFDTYQMLKYGQRLFGTFGLLGLIVYGAMTGYGALISRSELEDSMQAKRIGTQKLAEIKQKILDSKIDIDLVGNQIELYAQVKSEARTPLVFLAQLAPAIKQPVTLKSVNWKFGDVLAVTSAVPGFTSYNLSAAPAMGNQVPLMPTSMAPPMPGMPPVPNADAAAVPGRDMATAVLRLEFPVGLKTPALFKTFAEDFLKETHELMPDYAMAYTMIPPEYMDTKSLQMSFDEQAAESGLGQKTVMVDVTIRGLMPTALREGKAP